MFTRAVSRLGRKRPPSEIHGSDGAASVPDKEPRGAQKWAVSLDNLLEDPRGVSEFTDFLKREFSEENVLFWSACEDFKRSGDKDQMQKKAREIYTTFLSSKATTQVNVDGQSRISEQMLEDPHPLMFLRLQEQIYNLMKYDSYRRFLKSATFLALSASEDDELSTSGAGESAPKRASRIYNT